ncbi:MAG: hypothetical protein K6U00_06125 [Armatimonadetes bacterium]|nr:hypothetical protein [Armatimonadota bacterium]
MRVRLALITLIPILAGPVFTLPTDGCGTTLPIYPGAKVFLEINLSQEDLLPAVKQLLVVIPSALRGINSSHTESGAGETQSQKSPFTERGIDLGVLANDIKDVIKDLDRVSVVVYQLPSTTAMEKLPDFYMQKLGLTKGWTSIVRIQDSNQVFRMYSKPGMEGIFVLSVRYPTVVAMQTHGKLDVAKLGEILVNTVTAWKTTRNGNQATPPDHSSTDDQWKPSPEQ